MKSQRRHALLDIINNNRVATQKELRQALIDSGFQVTQATLSRDIKELQLVKIADEEGYYYALPGEQAARGTPGNRALLERLKRTFQDAVLAVESGEFLIVVKTLPGAAQSVASAIDNAGLTNVMGTVAGDDTIFMAIKNHQAVGEVEAILQGFLKNIYKDGMVR
jgi:transcriptional regulator of arginine metabolism